MFVRMCVRVSLTEGPHLSHLLFVCNAPNPVIGEDAAFGILSYRDGVRERGDTVEETEVPGLQKYTIRPTLLGSQFRRRLSHDTIRKEGCNSEVPRNSETDEYFQSSTRFAIPSMCDGNS